LSVEEPGAVGANETDPGTETEVEHAGALAEHSVLGAPVAKVVRDLDAIELREAGAQRAVKFV
jgi:hypothetical protein